MTDQFYQTAQFARKAAVTVRTLRYYDQQGLLSPTHHSPAGYRLYADADLMRLQKILALKLLGFSLREIKGYLQAGPQELPEVLAAQKAMLREKRSQLDTVIQAIDEVEQAIQSDPCSWSAIVHIIEVIQMEQNNDWVKKYFTPEQRQKMEALSEASYSQAAQEKMAGWTWTEEDQRRVDEQYAFIAAELKRLLAEGQDPASPDAQAVARLQTELLAQFTKGDPEIVDGLKQWWQNHEALPAEQKPAGMPSNEEEGTFLAQAMAIYQGREPGESWV